MIANLNNSREKESKADEDEHIEDLRVGCVGRWQQVRFAGFQDNHV